MFLLLIMANIITFRKTEAGDRVNYLPQTEMYIRERIRRRILENYGTQPGALLILLRFLDPLLKITHYCFDLARNYKPFQQLELKNTILCTGSIPTIKCSPSLKDSSGLQFYRHCRLSASEGNSNRSPKQHGFLNVMLLLKSRAT